MFHNIQNNHTVYKSYHLPEVYCMKIFQTLFLNFLLDLLRFLFVLTGVGWFLLLFAQFKVGIYIRFILKNSLHFHIYLLFSMFSSFNLALIDCIVLFLKLILNLLMSLKLYHLFFLSIFRIG